MASGTPQLTDRMRELTLALGRVVSAKATVQHRRRRSGGEGGATSDSDSQDGPDVAQQKEIVDAYGFTVMVIAPQLDALARCASQERRQLAKWREWPAEAGVLPPADRLKKLCRKGVPRDLRGWVWPEVSGATRRRRERPADYYLCAAAAGRSTSPFAHQIQLDVPRTFPSNAWVQSDTGQAALSRLLCAFSVHNPRVGYCQGMNYVAALLLCALGHNEESAFWVLASLIDDEHGILYQDLYARDLSGAHVEMRSLQELVQFKLPRLAAHMQALRCDMTILATDWFLCLFCTSLPATTAARVWDSLLLEGPKVLFRVALALLRMNEPALLAADNAGDLLRCTRGAAAWEHDCDKLLQVAFDGIGSLSMDSIRTYRDRNQRRLNLEFAARETRANLRKAVKEGNYVLQEGEAELLREPEEAPERRKPGWAGQLRALGSAVGDRTKATLDRSRHAVLRGTKSLSPAGSSSGRVAA